MSSEPVMPKIAPGYTIAAAFLVVVTSVPDGAAVPVPSTIPLGVDPSGVLISKFVKILKIETDLPTKEEPHWDWTAFVTSEVTREGCSCLRIL